jgi:hypothetical protein
VIVNRSGTRRLSRSVFEFLLYATPITPSAVASQHTPQHGARRCTTSTVTRARAAGARTARAPATPTREAAADRPVKNI